jgi:Tol biopolymer transport system component
VTLAAGLKLGPYEVIAPLGSGGMGEVYRARDTKLGREVAVKVLPAGLASDPERLARFEREARVLASLNHPHIAAIYGVEDSTPVKALILELVEGPTLQDRIEAGPIPREEALSIARQIAEALESAHERGIVHRDLKPANVKVGADDEVKVLDFGLAKALDPTASTSSPDITHSPTLSIGTQDGMILGTAAYMSPEQARGKPIDRRADIWAFGVVLCEMLTGRRLFEGETVSDTLAAVLRQEIRLEGLPPDTPPAVRALLARCLDRDPKTRLRDIGEARIALDPNVSPAPAAAEPPVVLASAAVRTRGLPLAVAAMLALVIGLATGWRLRRPAPESLGAGARVGLAIPDGFVLSPEQMPQLAISDDGRSQVVVVVDASKASHLLLRSIDQIEPRLLPDTDGANGPFFSPDGKWIGFFRGQSLFKIPTGGGAPVELASTASVTSARGATWSRDGFIYFAPSVSVGLSRIPQNGGPVTAVTRLDPARDERTHRWPQALPDGSAVLFTCDTSVSTEYYDDARIEAVRPSTGERKVLVEGASQARYGSGNRLVFARGGSLFAVAFDPGKLETRGTPDPVVQGVATDVGSGSVQFALSPSGAAVWAPGGLTSQYRLFWVDRNGVETPAPIPPEPYNEAELSPDGKRVALTGGQGGSSDLWVADLERGTQTRLTVGQVVANPVWTRDGARIAYLTRDRKGPAGHSQIFWVPADGSRNAELLTESEHMLSPSGFTADSGKLIYSASSTDNEAAGMDIYLLPVTGARKPELLLSDGFAKRGAVVSPDGRWMAYWSNEGGQQNIFVRPFPTGEGRWQISTAAAFEPRWGPEQKEIYYRSGAELYRVPVDTLHGFSAGRPEPVIDRVSTAGIVHTYAPAPDGRIFTPRSPEGRGSARTVNLDLGFAARLAALEESHP